MFTESYAAPVHGLGLLPGHAEDILRTTTTAGGGSSNSNIDWNQIIQSGFQFGTTFINDKYAKDASRSTGTYNPTGQTATQTYQPITAGVTPATGGALSIDKAVSGALAFVQKNIVLVGLGLAFLFAFKRDPNRARR